MLQLALTWKEIATQPDRSSASHEMNRPLFINENLSAS